MQHAPMLRCESFLQEQRVLASEIPVLLSGALLNVLFPAPAIRLLGSLAQQVFSICELDGLLTRPVQISQPARNAS